MQTDTEGTVMDVGDKSGDALSAAGQAQVAGLARRVFISYASHDRAVAQRACSALEARGVPCWIAPRDIVPGTLYAAGIVRAIDDSTILVVILSKHAVASAHVGREIERAVSKRHPVVALRIDAAPLTAAFEYFLNQSQWIDGGLDGIEAATATLVEAVRRHLGSEVGDSHFEPTPVAARAAAVQRRRWVLGGCFAVLVLALGYFAADKLWLTKSNLTSKALMALAPAGRQPAQVIPEKSVAVLPFLDMSEKKDQEYFSDGLAEELINMLTKIPDLRVPARTSSFYFKGKQTTIADIAKALGVTHILEGSVRKSGNNLRITAQLVRVENGYHIWSRTFDRQLVDIFKLQDEIAGAVVTALKVSLQSDATQESIGTQNSEAYNLYLQALHMARAAGNQMDSKKALDYVERAINEDPGFAAAWSEKASVLVDLGKQKEARQAAEQAIKLNPNYPNAYASLARVMMFDLDCAGAEGQLRRALELEPDNQWALAWVGSIATFRGEFDKANEILHRALARDPVNPLRYRDVAENYYGAGRYSEAIATYRRAHDIAPSWPEGHFLAAQILLAQGDAAAALEELDRENDAKLRADGVRVLMYDALNRKPEADAAMLELETTHADEWAYEIARVYASREEFDQAFRWFDRALRQRDFDLYWIKIDPLMKNVRTDPRYHALLLKLKLI